ncbi:MmcQ/YjbR family DNA-binding protein [Inquilinus sp. Marseille-Q2685]|uniref:MmcQ/YjbR family DNA-binding protein n=1 Tax=Inquilinus sp. Marseille-Q2685 TaxID=2866581 RepID=UPI001CE43F39|nr:MmcQ/YjbR family DNA-binding protein [Inquilinus sp. Marseille-Q2685]
MTFDDVCAIALAWPGVERSTSYGTPALKVKGKLLARLREDGETLVVPGVGFDEREMLIEAEPEVFHLSPHYRDWPIVLMRLPKAGADAVEALLLRRWREAAPKRLVKDFDAARVDQ